MRRRDAAVLVVAVLAVAAAVAGPATAAPGDGPTERDPANDESAATASVAADADGDDDGDDDDAAVTEFRTYDRLPDTKGTVRVTLRYELSAGVASVCVSLPRDAEDVNASGFQAADGFCDWHWDGDTESPTLTFTKPVDTMADSAPGPEVERNGWAYVEANVPGRLRLAGGDWQFFENRSTGEPRIDRRVEFSGGEGAATDAAAILGPVEVANWSGDGERFRVLTPAAGDVPLERYRPALTAASADLHVGTRRNITVYAFPDGVHTGSLYGDSILVPQIDGDTQQAQRIWIHEYVHARQRGFYPTDRLRWFVEASAEYYEYRLSLQRGEIDYATFRDGVTADRYTDAVLTNRSTWANRGVQYELGAHELAALDARIRAASNGTRTLEDVFYMLNRESSRVSYEDFADVVATVAGQRLDDWLDDFVASRDLPSVPESGDWLTEPDRPRHLDGDTLSTAAEKRRGLNPFAADSDGDGVRDGETPPTTTTTEPTTEELTTTTETSTTTPTTNAEPAEATTTATTDESPGTSPGFGVPAAVAALLAVGRWRRQS